MKTTTMFYGQMSINLMFASLLFLAFDFKMIFAFDCPNSKTPPLIIKRKRFYDSSTDEYFPIKGIAYYPRPNDGPLSKSNNVDFYTDEFSERWTEDIANLKEELQPLKEKWEADRGRADEIKQLKEYLT